MFSKIVHVQVMITCGSLGMTMSRYMYVRGRRISKHNRLVQAGTNDMNTKSDTSRAIRVL